MVEIIANNERNIPHCRYYRYNFVPATMRELFLNESVSFHFYSFRRERERERERENTICKNCKNPKMDATGIQVSEYKYAHAG